MNKITIAFAVDNNYAELLAVAILSILKNANKDSFLDFKILHNNLTNDNQNIILKSAQTFHNCSFEFINSDSFTKKFDLDKYINNREDYNYITNATYYRFFLPRLFPDLDKILYLDIDIVVLKDLWELFNTDLTNYIAGVVKDTLINILIKKNQYLYDKEKASDYLKNILHKKTLNYFNAGVILFNLKKMRIDNTEDKLWEYAQKTIREKDKEIQTLIYNDQDILNVVLENDVTYLDLKYNISQYYNYLNPVIIHFIGSKKPHNSGKRNKYFNLYWDYLKQTPFFTEQRKKEYEIFSKNLFISLKIRNFNLFEIYEDSNCYRIKLFSIKTKIKKRVQF